MKWKNLFTQRQPPALFHITHWKAGSQWIYRILLEAVPADKIIPAITANETFQTHSLLPGKVYPSLYVSHEEFYRAQLPQHFSKFVIIRDLRDTLISDYFSTKISHPLSFAFRIMREILNELTLEQGLLFLIRDRLYRCAYIQNSCLMLFVKYCFQSPGMAFLS